MRTNRWWALAALCVSLLVVTMQSSVLNVALPTLVRSLGASDSELQWIVDSGYVAFAGVLLTGAALADRFGRRGVMAIGLAIVGGGSVAAALSTTPAQLIVWRSVMGAAAALVMPATLSILVNIFTEVAERRRAIAIWSLMNAIGSFIGPVTGGALLRWFSWNACFWVVVPFAALATVMAYLFVPTSRDPAAARFDLLGAVLSTLALGSLVGAIIEAPTDGWTAPLVLTAFGVALASGIAFVGWESRCRSPMLDLSMFLDRQFSAAAVALTLAFLALTSSSYLIGLTLQFVKGYSPLSAAIATAAPITLINLMVVPAAPMLIRRFGPRRLVSFGIATIAASSLVAATISITSPYWILGLAFALMALAFSTFVPASTEVIMTSVPAERSGGASAANQLTRQVGQSLGIALGGGIAAFGYHSHFSAAGYGLTAHDTAKANASLPGALSSAGAVVESARNAFLTTARDAYLYGVRMTLVVCAVLALLGAIYAAIAIPSQIAARDPELADAVMPAGLPAEPLGLLDLHDEVHLRPDR